jgi:hypothetical protein
MPSLPGEEQWRTEDVQAARVDLSVIEQGSGGVRPRLRDEHRSWRTARTAPKLASLVAADYSARPVSRGVIR